MADDDLDLSDYADTENSDEPVQMTMDIAGQTDGDEFVAAKAATDKAADAYQKGQDAQQRGQDWTNYNNLGNFFSDVADMILKNPQWIGVARAFRDDTAKIMVESQAISAYQNTTNYIHSRPDLDDEKLVQWGDSLAKRSLADCPFRQAIIRAITDELARRHSTTV